MKNGLTEMVKPFLFYVVRIIIIYILRMIVPGSKYAKQKELYEMLKILLIYEEGKKK
jgi:hypothetical protein